MARIKDITWSQTVHSPRSLLERYGASFPVYVLVQKGFCGRNDIETISTNQMARIDSVCEQKRVLILDMTGQYLSVPADFNAKFIIKEKRKIKRKTMKQILKRYKLPVPISVDPDFSWYLRPTNRKYANDNWRQLLILATYTEKFFKLNTINDGVIDKEVSLLPLYINIELRVAEGMKASCRTSWQHMTDMYNSVVSLRNQNIKPPEGVLLLSKSDVTNHFPPIEYEISAQTIDNDVTLTKRKKRYGWRYIKTEMAPHAPASFNKIRTSRVANGRVNVGVTSSTQTDDESSFLSDEIAPSAWKPRSRPVRHFRYQHDQEADGYFSETETMATGTGGIVPHRKLYSSTGDLWRQTATLNGTGPTRQSRQHRSGVSRRVRSASMNHVDRIRHYGTTLMAGGHVDRDFGFYGEADKPATFRRRVPTSSSDFRLAGSLYRKRIPSGMRTAAIIKLRDVPDRENYVVMTPNNTAISGENYDTMTSNDVTIKWSGVRRANSCSYDTSQGRTSPTLSIPLGDTRNINISTLTRSRGMRLSCETASSQLEGGGAVLTPGEPLVEPEKDLELLHIEVQGAEKEWTLKRQLSPKSPAQQSSTSSVCVQTPDALMDDVSYEDRILRRGTRAAEHDVVDGSQHVTERTDRVGISDHGRADRSRDRQTRARATDVSDGRHLLDGAYHGNFVIRNPRTQRGIAESRSKKASRTDADQIDDDDIAYVHSRHAYYDQSLLDRSGCIDLELQNRRNLADFDGVRSVKRETVYRSEAKETVPRIEAVNLQGTNTRSILKIDPDIDRRSRLLSNSIIGTSSYNSLQTGRSSGLATYHISRRFKYEPVQQRYHNRNHYYSNQGWNLVYSGADQYTDADRLTARLSSRQTTGQADGQADGQFDVVSRPTILDRLPDFIDDGRMNLRDVHVSYTDRSSDGRSSGTLTPSVNVIGDNQLSPAAIDDDLTGSHVQVISVGMEEAGSNDVAAETPRTEPDENSSEIIVFTDSVGTLYNTSMTSLIESSRNEAMKELDKMAGSQQTNSEVDSQLSKQDDNNNHVTTGCNGVTSDHYASDDESYLSSGSSGQAFFSYEVEAVQNSSRQELDHMKEQRGENHLDILHTDTAVNGWEPAASDDLHPGDGTLKSTEGIRDRKKDVEDILAGATWEENERSQIHSELGKHGTEEVALSSQTSQVSITNGLDTEGSTHKTSGSSQESYSHHQSIINSHTDATSLMETMTSLEVKTSSKQDPEKIQVVSELVRTGSVSSLRQVYKTPPSSLRMKKKLSVAKSSEIFVNSLNATEKSETSAATGTGSSDVSMAAASGGGRASTTSGAGKFLMRFKEGDTLPADQSGSQTTVYGSYTAITGSQSVISGSQIHVAMAQDFSLPVNEEVQLHDVDNVSMRQADDTLSQSSYSSSKLEHFNFGLANFDMNF